MSTKTIDDRRRELRTYPRVKGLICVASLLPAFLHAGAQAPSTPPVEQPAAQRGLARQHANAEHPGVVQWQRAHLQGQVVDANRFLVQPPAAVTWRDRPDAEALQAQLTPR